MQRWLAVLVLFSGCAFGLSGPDPDRPRSKMPKCDTSKAMVALDGAMAMTAGLVGIAVASDTEPAVALLPLSIGAIYLGGAIRGNNNVNKCRAAMSEFEMYAEGRAAPAPSDDVVVDEAEARRMRPALGPAPQADPVNQPTPAVVVAPPPTQVTAAPTPAPAPAPAPPVAASPAPVVKAPAPAAKAPGAKAPAAKPAAPAPEDDWVDFWREVD